MTVLYYEPHQPSSTMRCKNIWISILVVVIVIGLIAAIVVPFYVFEFSSQDEPEASRLSSIQGDVVSRLPPAVSSVVINQQKRTRSANAHLRHLRWNRKDSGIDHLLRSNHVIDSVKGIYWSDEVERLISRGFPVHRDALQWRNAVRQSTVRSVRDGCGRMQNRLIEFNTGTLSCARYRQNNDQIQGELFSFYLAQELGINNVPPAVVVRAAGKAWDSVRPTLDLAQWRNNRPVVLTKFIDNLEPAYIPEEFRSSKNRHLYPSDLINRTAEELRELVQWSDLIVFDYLTANLDRVINNMFNLQWNPDMMSAPAHNLARQKDTGFLVFLDNESGLVHGYRLLDKYEGFHRTLLNSLCVFRKSTAEAVMRLARSRDIGDRLRTMFSGRDPGMDAFLPFLPERSIKQLNRRLVQVVEQIERCQSNLGNDVPI